MASTNVVNLIGTIIDSFRDTYAITSITHVGTTYTINTSDTKRLAVGSYVSISGNNYEVLTLIANTSFTINSTINVIGTSWKALAPYYFYGTPIMISNTLDKYKNYKQKFPVIVLFETMPAIVNDETTLNIERVVSLEMYFCNEANFKDWSHDEYYTYVIDVLQTYVDDFITKISNHRQIGELDKHNETPYSKWNLVRLDTGKNVFNSELSAIKLEIDLPILKTLECESN